jgi:hypothetical protein
MKIEWIILAEGAVNDSRGALTAVGLNQNVFAPTSLPASTKRALIIHLVDVEPSSTIALNFSVKDPDGTIIAAQSNTMNVGDAKFQDLPLTTDVVVEAMFAFKTSGTHLVDVEIASADLVSDSKAIEIYVRKPGESEVVDQAR